VNHLNHLNHPNEPKTAWNAGVGIARQDGRAFKRSASHSGPTTVLTHTELRCGRLGCVDALRRLRGST
jgi:hypothetical protein